MKKLLVAVTTLLLASVALGQQPLNYPTGAAESLVNGIYYAPQYATWSDAISTGVLAGGTSITVNWPSAILADGREVLLFSNSSGQYPTITVGAGSTQETVAVTSVSGCSTKGRGLASFQTCIVSASGTFSNAHGVGELVTSGDFGIVEALNDAASNGGGPVFWQVDTGPVTLSTGGLTTTTTVKVPGSFYNFGSASRVTTTITTATNWAVGISGATAIFSSANSTLTAGTTAVANQATPATTGTAQTMTALLVTCTGSNPGAGAVHIRAWGYTAAQPAF